MASDLQFWKTRPCVINHMLAVRKEKRVNVVESLVDILRAESQPCALVEVEQIAYVFASACKPVKMQVGSEEVANGPDPFWTLMVVPAFRD